MKKYWILTLLMTLAGASMAQDDTTVFPFLRLPHSAHATALGGENITTITDDLTLAFHNPALLSNVADKTLNLNFTSYIEGSKVASAAFSRQFGERSAWAASVQYMDYGKITETDIENNELGTLSAKDMAFMGTYSYLLSEQWSGGVTAKFIHGSYAEYTSFAIGVDLGLNYFHEEKELSASLTLKNLGGQVKTFDEENEKLPLNMQVGFTKRLAHAPIRISVTLDDLTHWESSYYNPEEKNVSFGDLLFNHVILGVEIAPSERFYLSAGYNFKRGNDLKAEGGSKWTGATIGGGLQMKRIKLGVAYANYHTAASSLVLNFSMGL
jgi:long-subunit fatty acid transport protein